MAKKINNNAAFLVKFKECEQLIRQTYGDDKNFKWFEDKIKDDGEDQMSQKMCAGYCVIICRIIRMAGSSLTYQTRWPIFLMM